MNTRIIYSLVILLQLSGCLATPRFASRVSDEYEPPQEQEQLAEQPAPQLSEETKAEIRRQVQEEMKLQNAQKTITQQ